MSTAVKVPSRSWSTEGSALCALRCKVIGDAYTVTDAAGTVLPVSVTPLDTATKEISLAYLTDLERIDPEKVLEYTNKATHTVRFAMALPAVGYTTFRLQRQPAVVCVHSTVVLTVCV